MDQRECVRNFCVHFTKKIFSRAKFRRPKPLSPQEELRRECTNRKRERTESEAVRKPPVGG
eukprot:971397-Pleurochrysis_carterae.AAC.1